MGILQSSYLLYVCTVLWFVRSTVVLGPRQQVDCPSSLTDSQFHFHIRLAKRGWTGEPAPDSSYELGSRKVRPPAVTQLERCPTTRGISLCHIDNHLCPWLRSRGNLYQSARQKRWSVSSNKQVPAASDDQVMPPNLVLEPMGDEAQGRTVIRGEASDLKLLAVRL